MNKKKSLMVLALAACCMSLCAQTKPPKPYDYWPDTDTEWTKLTNHIVWCCDRLIEREYAATGQTNNMIGGSVIWYPEFVCPYRDYTLIAREIDRIAPLFVNQTLAGSGEFAEYFSSATNESQSCPTAFPCWTPESLHMQAFGRTTWSTNSLMTAWMAVTNRAFINEVTAAIKLLKWTYCEDSYFGMTNGYGWVTYADLATNESCEMAGNLLEEELTRSRTSVDFSSHFLFARNSKLTNNDNGYLSAGTCCGYGLELDVEWGYWWDRGYRKGDRRTFGYNVNVLAFIGKKIKCSGYEPDESVTKGQKVYLCEDLGLIDTGRTSIVTFENPLADDVAGNSPHVRAGLDSAWHEDAHYEEEGYSLWLIKWVFENDDFPEEALPSSSPIETPDSDEDDIVQVLGIEDDPCAETGTFVVSHKRRRPYCYVPLTTESVWDQDVPAHGYVSQGVVTNLPYHYWPWGARAETGNDNILRLDLGREMPLLGLGTAHYSLNSCLLELSIVTNETQHVKQALLLRPCGQVVVFDFPWTGSTFSERGYPTGINRKLGYVLYDYVGANVIFSLLFPSGVVHIYTYQNMWSPFYLTCVAYDNSRYHVLSPLEEFSDRSWGQGSAQVAGGRYCATMSWQGGRPISATYTSQTTGETVESVRLEYEAQVVKRLAKDNAESGSRLLGNNSVCYGSGVVKTIAQSQADGGLHVVTIEKCDSGGTAALSLSETRYIDGFGRLVKQVTSSGKEDPLITEYTYNSDLEARYPVTGYLMRNSISELKQSGAFGTRSEFYEYSSDCGWIVSRKYALGGGADVVSINDYRSYTDENRCLWWAGLNIPLQNTCLKSTTIRHADKTIGKMVVDVDGLIGGIWEICGLPDAEMDDEKNICFRSQSLLWVDKPWLGGCLSYLKTPAGTLSVRVCGESLSDVNLIASLQDGAATNIMCFNDRGICLSSRVETRGGAIVDTTNSDVDGRGRPIRTRFMDGTEVSFQDYCLHGPKKIVNRDGSLTTLDYDAFGRVKHCVNGETGISHSYEYDPLGNVTRQTRMAGGKVLESVATYSLDGTLIYSRDESGHEVSIAGQYVDGYLVLTRSETGRGSVVETYWGDGVLKSVSGPGAARRFDRERGVSTDDNRHWIKEVNPDNPGEWVKDWYAFNGLYESTERPGGVVEYVEYDQRLDIKARVNGDNVKTVFSHDAGHFGLPALGGLSEGGAQSLNLATDLLCVSNAYSFTSQGLRTTRYSFPDDGSDEPFEEATTLVSADGASGSFEVNGQPGSFSCDAPPSTGAYTKTVNMPNGTVMTSTYRKFLLRESTRRDAGLSRKVTNTFHYDAFGSLVSFTTDEKGYKETIAIGRDGKRQVNRVSSSSRGATTLSLDEAGRVTRVSSPSFGVTSLDWYQNGLLKSSQNNAGPLFSRAVDPFGRVSAVTRLLGGQTSVLGFDYGNDGNFVSKTRDGVKTLNITTRRADGRPKTAVLPGGVTVSRTYGGGGNVVAQTFGDPLDASAFVAESYSWHRDGSLRKAGQSGGPYLSNSVFRAAGRVLSKKTAFEWPLLPTVAVLTSLSGPGGRPSGVTAQFAGFTNMSLTAGVDYDTLCHLGTLSGDGFFATFATTSGGLVTNTVVAVDGVELLNRKVTWSASAGKPSRVDYALSGHFLRRWQYAFTNGLIASVSRSGGDGYRTDYTYDGGGQLLSATSRSTNNLALAGLSFGYAYSPAGNTIRFGRQNVLCSAGSSGDLHPHRIWTPSVSILGRLSETGAAVKVTLNATTNSGEVVGGIVNAAILDNSASPYAFATGVVTVIATLPGGTSDTCRLNYSLPAAFEFPTYNARGMILSDSRRQYRWDAAGRLMAVTNFGANPAVALKLDYFADGRRASKTVSVLTNGAWAVSRTLQYAWQGWKLAAECERDGTGNIAAVRHFVWGPDVVGQQTASLDSDAEGVGGLLLIREWKPGRGIRVYLPISDGLGNVCALIDASDGSLAAEYDYDPYGALVVGCGPAMDVCPFRHRTRYYDPETWLYYYGYRYYDPSVTKWISKDPLGEAGGWNLTCFCGNDPVNQFDPLGLALYAFDGTWNDYRKMARPTNISKLRDLYEGLAPYAKGVGTDWYTKCFGGVTGAGGQNRINEMYEELQKNYRAGDHDIDIIGFSRGAAEAREFANKIASEGIKLDNGQVVYPQIRFLGLFDTVASFGIPGNGVNIGYRLAIPKNVKNVRHAVAADEKRGAFPLSSVLADPLHPDADPRIIELSFRGAHSDVGGGYEIGDRSNFALLWMRYEALSCGVPLAPIPASDLGAQNPIIHDERGWLDRWRNKPRTIYYYKNER